MDNQRNDREIPVYPIGSVERLAGLTARQIRYYERKGLINPARTSGKQRLYSRAQVERLQLIKKLLAEGISLQNIKEFVDREVTGEGGNHPEKQGYSPPADSAGGRLRSLYPVTDEARLMEILRRRRDEDDGA